MQSVASHHLTNLYESIPVEIFDQPEAFDAYLTDVRERRERRRVLRAAREHWLRAVAALEAELALARQEEDAEIEAELRTVLEAFTRRLQQEEEAGASPVLFHSHAVITAPVDQKFLSIPVSVPVNIAALSALANETSVEERASTEVRRGETAVQPKEAADSTTSVAAPLGSPADSALSLPASEKMAFPPQEGLSDAATASPDANVVAQPESAEAQPVLSAEEQAEIARTLRAELNALEAQWTQMDAEGLADKYGAIRRPEAFALRALACRVGGVYARVRDAGVTGELRTPVRRLRDKLELARAYANDRCDCLPFAEECWTDKAGCLTALEWDHLAARYADTARAQTAYEWYSEHQEALGQPFRLELLNAIGALQQALFRALGYYGGGDRLQGDLYGCLLEAARPNGFITTLHPEMSDAELETAGGWLDDLMGRGAQEAVDNKVRQEKEARKTSALNAALAYFEQHPTVGASDATLATDRKALLPLLKECLAASVPATNVQIRNFLLLHGPRLLEGQEGCSRILEAVVTERRRRGMDALAQDTEDSADEEPSESAVEEFLQLVRPFTEGQRLLILGGVPRQRVCEELEQTLGCLEVKWPPSKKSDHASKFQADIKRANMLLLVKNFASHDMSEKGREWVKSAGGHFVYIPSGYGVNQLINQLYKYVLSDKARA